MMRKGGREVGHNTNDYKIRPEVHNIIQAECGEYPRLLRGMLSVSRNIVMDLNNVMHMFWLFFGYSDL